MSFKYEKVLELHKKSGEKSKEFACAIFGPNSKLGPEYFNNKKSISTRHLELLCAHFKVPMTFFFDDSDVSILNNVESEGSQVVNSSDGNSDNQRLQETIKHLEAVIEDKDEQIKWLKTQWDSMLKTFQSLGK